MSFIYEWTLSFNTITLLKYPTACVCLFFFHLLLMNGTRRTPTSLELRVCSRAGVLPSLSLSWGSSSSAQLPPHCSACPSPCPPASNLSPCCLLDSELLHLLRCWGHSRRSGQRAQLAHVSEGSCALCTLSENPLYYTHLSTSRLLYLRNSFFCCVFDGTVLLTYLIRT